MKQLLRQVQPEKPAAIDLDRGTNVALENARHGRVRFEWARRFARHRFLAEILGIEGDQTQREAQLANWKGYRRIFAEARVTAGLAIA